MKKLFAGVLAAALALSVLTASAFAAPGANYVDADGDGVCDLLAAGGGGCGNQNYVDNNGDGVCDNFAARPQDGTGCQSGHGSGHRQGGHHGGRGR